MNNIMVAFEKALAGSAQAQRSYIQQLLPGASQPESSAAHDGERAADEKVYDRYLIRSDAKAQKIEQFFGSSVSKSYSASQSSSQSDAEMHDDEPREAAAEDASDAVLDECNTSERLDDTSESVLDPIPRSQHSQINDSLNDTIQLVSNYDRFRVNRRVK